MRNSRGTGYNDPAMKKQLPNVEIHAVDGRGRGRGTALAGDDTVRPVLVMGAYPGDVVDVRVRRRKAGAYLGEVERIHPGAGPARRDPFCVHFADCGGCTLQDITYADQLAYKEAIVAAAFGETDLAALPEPHPILPAPHEVRYRNKLEFSFGAQRWLSEEEIGAADTISDRRGFGFHAAGRFDRVIDLRECHLQPEPSETIRELCARVRVVNGGSRFTTPGSTTAFCGSSRFVPPCPGRRW